MNFLTPPTKRKPILIFVRLLGALLLVAVALAPKVQAGEIEAQCPRGDATLRGTYMSKGGGTIVGTGPITFIGTVYFDGQGGVTNPFTGSLNGTIIRATGAENFGTYSINSDCSGTQILGGGHFDIRISPDGNKVDYIDTDSPEVVSGSATRVND
jgi:hypothetical protein